MSKVGSSTRIISSFGRFPQFGRVFLTTVVASAVGLAGCAMEDTSSEDLRSSAADNESTTDRDPPPKDDGKDKGNDKDKEPSTGSPDAGAPNDDTPGSSDPPPPPPPSYAVGDTFRTTADLNLRSGPGTEHSIVLTMPNNAVVALVAAAPTNGFYNVKYASLTGWASEKFLVAAPGAKVEDFPIQKIITPVPVLPHVQAFANVACGTVGCPDNVSSYHGHSPHVTQALDVFQLRERGDKFADFAVADKTHKLHYVIWRQRINMRNGSGWQWMEDRGSITQNHYDHVHVSFYK